MADTEAKARGIRLERLRSMLEKDLANPRAALETLMSELRIGDEQPKFWEQLHGAAVRNAKEAELADAYRKMAADRRLKTLSPSAHANLLMHAADFFQGVVGDGEGAERFLWSVLEVAPDQVEAFNRLEHRFEAASDELRLVELYAIVSRTPPKPPAELAHRALKIVALLSAKTPLSDKALRGMLGLVPSNAAILSVIEAHCQKTNRIALACSLLEEAIVAAATQQRVLRTQAAMLELEGRARVVVQPADKAVVMLVRHAARVQRLAHLLEVRARCLVAASRCVRFQPRAARAHHLRRRLAQELYRRDDGLRLCLPGLR